MPGPHGRLSPGYVQEVVSMANAGTDEAAMRHHGRLAPEYAGAELSLQPPAAPAAVHGRLTGGYIQAVAEFLANSYG